MGASPSRVRIPHPPLFVAADLIEFGSSLGGHALECAPFQLLAKLDELLATNSGGSLDFGADLVGEVLRWG